MRIRNVTAGFVLLAGLGLAACGDDPKDVDGKASLVGTWDVQSINGDALPITETEEVEPGYTCSFTIESIEITFTTAGSYSGQQKFTSVCTGEDTQTQNFPFGGTYRTSGSTLFMTDTGDVEESVAFTVSGSTATLTFTEDGETEVIVLKRR